MKIKHIAVMAAALVAGTAFAQSSVTLYGVLDTGVRFDNNADGRGNNATYIPNGIQSNSRFGLKGKEDLGGGLKIGFQLESGFNLGNGKQDGIGSGTSTAPSRIFNRASKVGIESEYGSVYFGRAYNILYDTISMYEPTDFINSQSYLGGNSVVTTGNFTDGYRSDNNIRYSGTFGPVGVTASYAPGGVAGSMNSGSKSAIGFSYTDYGFQIGTAFNRTVSNGNTYTANSMTLANPATATANTDTFTIGGSYTYGPVKGMLGYAYTKNGTMVNPTGGKANQWTAFGGLIYSVTPAIDLTGAYYHHRLNANSATGASDGKADVFVFIADYKLSKRTDVFASYDYTRTGENDGLQATYFPTTGAASADPAQNTRSGVSVGIRHRF